MGEIGLSGRDVIGALKTARIEFVVALPDATMSEHVLWPLAKTNDFKLVRVCKEDEGVSICAGLLMDLGSLVTVAAAAPPNYYHFVCENGDYEANGSHPIPGRGTVNFAGHARAAGYPHTFEFGALDKFEAEIGGLLALKGPVFATLKIVIGEKSPHDFAFANSRETHRQFAAAIDDVLGREGR